MRSISSSVPFLFFAATAFQIRVMSCVACGKWVFKISIIRRVQMIPFPGPPEAKHSASGTRLMMKSSSCVTWMFIGVLAAPYTALRSDSGSNVVQQLGSNSRMHTSTTSITLSPSPFPWFSSSSSRALRLGSMPFKTT